MGSVIYIYFNLLGMETDRFKVHRETEEVLPTALMLSHVCEVKDVKNAIRAANVIVHTYHITDYRLIIYGSLTRDSAYTNDCRNMVSSMSLTENVFLMGLVRCCFVNTCFKIVYV